MFLIIKLGLGLMWHLDTFEYTGVTDFGMAVLLAIIGAAMGWGFIYCVKFFKTLFEKRPIPIYIKTFIGGILLGTIAYYFPLTRYFSHFEESR